MSEANTQVLSTTEGTDVASQPQTGQTDNVQTGQTGEQGTAPAPNARQERARRVKEAAARQQLAFRDDEKHRVRQIVHLVIQTMAKSIIKTRVKLPRGKQDAADAAGINADLVYATVVDDLCRNAEEDGAEIGRLVTEALNDIALLNTRDVTLPGNGRHAADLSMKIVGFKSTAALDSRTYANSVKSDDNGKLLD